MRRKNYSKLSASDQKIPSSASSDDIVDLIGGTVESSDHIGRASRDRKRNDENIWDKYAPVDFKTKVPSAFSHKDLMMLVADRIRVKYDIILEVGVPRLNSVLRSVKEMLIQRFPSEQEISITAEYLKWYFDNLSDHDMATSVGNYWNIAWLKKPKNIAQFCEYRHVVLAQQLIEETPVKRATDEKTLTNRLNDPLEFFVEDYGPIIPFVILRRNLSLFAPAATEQVVRACQNLLATQRRSYDYLAKVISVYAPYPSTFRGFEVDEFVIELSRQLRYDFHKCISYREIDD